ncbi:MAG TPA: BTAD domain-containing putative transcriptional regulator [Gemmatimonadaceae bacterium]
MTASAPPSSPISPYPGAPAEPPVHLTPFIGRERELSELSGLLGATRLVTLTGAGGSGKTRLAREAAVRTAPAFGRVVWVGLAAVADPGFPPTFAGACDAPCGAPGARDAVAHEITAALGAVRGGDSLTEAIAAAIRDTSMLLVLDGVEHVVEACAGMVELLLRACPRLSVLVTSREALGIPSETAWLVPPLGGAEAEQLFLDRARAAFPGFAITTGNAAAVREICRRLDGLPLAIELAAARVRVLSPEQIAERLGDALRLLTTGSRTALPRHRTLRGTIDWSYHLLGAREQVLLARLAVFSGSFSLEAAERVCSGAPLDGEDILDGIAVLADKSLLVMEPTEARARYRLLETIRQYGMERLGEAADVERLRERHGRYFLHVAEAAAPRLLAGAGDSEVMARMEDEHENLRAAEAWAASDPARGAEALRFADVLFWYRYGKGSWLGTGQFREVRRAVADALARGGAADPLLRGRMLAADGLNAFAQGDYEHARASLAESLALVRVHGDEGVVAFVLSKLGAVEIMRGERTAARELLDEAFAIVRRLPASVLHAYVCLWRGWAAHVRGDAVLARAMLDEAIQHGRAMSHRGALAHASALLARVEYAEGHFGRASALLGDALRTDLEAGDGWGLALDLEGLVGLAVARGAPADAARLMGAVDALRERIAVVLPACDRAERERLLAIVRRELGREFDGAYREGRSLPLHEIVRAACDGAIEHTAEYRVPEHAEPAPAPAGRSTLRVRALGPLEISTGGEPIDAAAWGSARSRELLVYLVMHPEGRTKEQVGLDFWPEASAAQLRNNFHVTLHRLRRALRHPEWILLSGDRYRVDPAVVGEVDVLAFEREVAEARRALARDEGDAPAALERALTRFRGDFLDGEVVGDWHLEHRDRLQRTYVEALTALGARLAEQERWAKAADAYRRVLARDDLHEEAARALMRCHIRLGERAQALQLYQRFAERLRAELDAEPDGETVELYERAQRGS